MVVRSGQGISQFFFFDITPPLVLDNDSEAVKQAAESMEYVDAYCISRVAVPTHMIPSIIQALQSNLRTQQTAIAEVLEIDPDAVQKAIKKAMGENHEQ